MNSLDLVWPKHFDDTPNLVSFVQTSQTDQMYRQQKIRTISSTSNLHIFLQTQFKYPLQRHIQCKVHWAVYWVGEGSKKWQAAKNFTWGRQWYKIFVLRNRIGKQHWYFYSGGGCSENLFSTASFLGHSPCIHKRHRAKHNSYYLLKRMNWTR